MTAGQSFHWFDECRALPEIARVLRPGGLLAVVFNLRDESEPWVAELGRILRGQDGSGNSGTDAGMEDFGPLFGPVEHVAVPHVQTLDVPGLVGLAGTRSYALVLPPDERAPLLAAVETLGRQVAGELHPMVRSVFPTSPSASAPASPAAHSFVSLSPCSQRHE